MLSARLSALCLLTFFLALPARAQCTLQGWLLASGANDVIQTQLTLPNGDVILAGGFTQIGPIAALQIARYSPATNTWSPLGGGITAGLPNCLAALPNGDIIVGGSFTKAGGITVRCLARYTPSTQTWSALGTGANGVVYAMAVLPNGDLVIGGSFTTVNGVSASRIARYNPTTGVWSPLGTGVISTVFSLAVMPDGDLIVGGNFNRAGSLTVSKIARCNPDSGQWFDDFQFWPYAALTSVKSLLILPSGQIVIGGTGSAAFGIMVVTYDPISRAWAPLLLGTSTNSPSLNAMALLPNGDLVVGGKFTSIFGLPVKNVARYSFSNGLSTAGGGIDGIVYSLSAQSDSAVLVGGQFTAAGLKPASNLVRFDPSADHWSPFQRTSPGNSINATHVLPTGDVIVGGAITSMAGVSLNGIGRYDPRSCLWSPLGSGVGGTIHAISSLQNGDIIAGGDLTSAGGAPASGIARFNPTSDTWSDMNAGLNPGGTANAFLRLPDGDLIVGGAFTSAGNVAANNIARYTPDTGLWSSIGSGVSGTVWAFALLPDGDIIVGGELSSAGNIPVNNLARFNPSTGDWSNVEGGITSTDPAFPAIVHALAVKPTGELVVGGKFNRAGIASVQNVAIYNPSNGQWMPQGFGFDGDASGYQDTVFSLAVLAGGDVLAAGHFTSATYLPAKYLARFNPMTRRWSALANPQMSTAPVFGVRSIAVFPNNDIIAGGDFTLTDGANTVNSFAQYTFDGMPGIASQPQPLVLCTGATATFHVTAAGAGPFTYQWQKNGDDINTSWFPSAATDTFTIFNVHSGENGNYTCRISSDCDSTLTAPAKLRVCTSDLTCDGYVDDADFSLFALAYNIFDCTDPAMPAGCTADINQDGMVDDADFSAFAIAYDALVCS